MNLLTAHLFEVRSDHARKRVTLPGLFELWATAPQEEVWNLDGVRAHHSGPVEAFMALLAAHALEVNQRSELLVTESDWKAALLSLTPGESASFWELVTDDQAKPAFMQPPIDARATGMGKISIEDSPDCIDTLVTSKQHDVKDGCMRGAEPAHWIYALISTQMTAIYLGSGNYGTFRVNSGYGSRFFAATYTQRGMSGRWREDVLRLLKYWQSETESLDMLGYCKDRAKAVRLAALVPCDPKASSATGSASIGRLHPGAIEVSRIVRLLEGADGIYAQKMTSSSALVSGAKELSGLTGDPWMPTRVEGKDSDGKVVALSVGDTFGISALLRLLFEQEGVSHSPFMRNSNSRSGGAPYLLVRVLGRSQGKTSGYAEFEIPMATAARRSLFSGPKSDRQKAVDAYQQLARLGKAVAGRMVLALNEALDMGAGSKRAAAVRQAASAVFANTLEVALRQSVFECIDTGHTDDERILSEFKRKVLSQAKSIFKEHVQENSSAIGPVGMARASMVFDKKVAKI